LPVTKIAYLTIDDAPSPDFMYKLNFLDSLGVRAVWFCQGNNMEERPEMVIEAIKRGHIIGNHTYSHPHCSDLSLDQVYAEIRATHAIIEELYQQSGIQRPARFFRFPYGDKGDDLRGDPLAAPTPAGKARREAIQAYLRRLGYVQPKFPDITYGYYHKAGLLNEADWYWTYDTHDWIFVVDDPPHGIDSVEKILERLDEDAPEEWRGLNYPASADIVCTHDHAVNQAAFTAEVNRMIEKGIEFRMPAV
jgi:peptidoglycan/xylan/chitin deacetylase (PgdA/CDA1 family)